MPGANAANGDRLERLGWSDADHRVRLAGGWATSTPEPANFRLREFRRFERIGRRWWRP